MSYTIAGLTPNTVYDLRLKAIGDGVNYKSVYSDVVQAQTLPSSSASLALGDELFDEFFDELDEDDYDPLAVNFVG